jgi:hypothetical protein
MLAVFAAFGAAPEPQGELTPPRPGAKAREAFQRRHGPHYLKMSHREDQPSAVLETATTMEELRSKGVDELSPEEFEFAKVRELAAQTIHYDKHYAGWNLADALSDASKHATIYNETTLGTLAAEVAANKALQPRLFASVGCSDSTVVGDLAGHLLEAHGVSVNNHGVEFKEWFQPRMWVDTTDCDFSSKMECKYNWQKKARTIEQQIVTHALAGQAFLFEGEPTDKRAGGLLVEPEVVEQFNQEKYAVLQVLKQYGTKLVHFQRTNLLDQLVCKVRDCFVSSDPLHSVDKAGQPSNLCFNRRELPRDQQPYAYIDEKQIVAFMENAKQAKEDEVKALAGFDMPFDSVASEELFSYEFDMDEASLQTSVKAWSTFLKSCAVKPDEVKITEVLTPQRGGFQLEMHNDTIYNIEEIAKHLKGTEFEKLLRLAPPGGRSRRAAAQVAAVATER